MSARIKLARLLLRLGVFIESLPVVVMKPDDLVEFSHQNYIRSEVIESWSDDVADSGLTHEELDLLSAIPEKTGNLLLLGVGGGREAIPLAQMGLAVTGVDFVPAMVERARENAARRGVHVEGMVQEISQLDVPANHFNLVWLSSAAYSCVPTRARRVEMVRRIARTLQPNGFFLFQFQRSLAPQSPGRGSSVRRLVAACTRGNTEYQEGDLLWGNVEYLHAFGSVDEVRAEVEEGGLGIVCFQTERNPVRCGAVCRKCEEMSVAPIQQGGQG